MFFDVDTKKLNALAEYVNATFSEYTYSSTITRIMMNEFGPTLIKQQWRITRGASKVVLVNKKKNFVIKFTSGDYQRYVKAEALIYEEAKKRGLDMFFPTTELVPGTSIVLQRKIDFSVNDIPEEFLLKIRRQIKTVNNRIINSMMDDIYDAQVSNKRQVNYRWLSLIVVLYGKKKVGELVQLIKDCHINDLHDDNIGYLKGRPIFLDFSGFDGQEVK